MATGVTNAHGRITEFVPLCPQAATGWWRRWGVVCETGRETIYPCAQIDFVTGETADEHFPSAVCDCARRVVNLPGQLTTPARR
jgi:5-hydroxyisourate hydrolase